MWTHDSMFSTMRAIWVVLPLVFLAACGKDGGGVFSGGGGSSISQQQIEQIKTNSFNEGYNKALGDQKQQAKEALEKARGDISGHLILASLIAVFGVLLGPAFAEWMRTQVVNTFTLTIPEQVGLAHWLFWLTVAGGVIATFTIAELRLVRPAVYILIAGAVFSFLSQLLPAINQDDKAARKQAVAKIKSLLFLILVFYILLSILSERGFLNLTIKI